MRIKAVFNRDGGTFKTTDMDRFCAKASEVFRAAGHEISCEVVEGKALIASLERVASSGDIDVLVAGGGDGTISAAAGIAWKNGVALGVVPAGTMNLFARSLKIPLDIWQALDALAVAEIRPVDICTVNGKPFIHQFSAGLHARMVRLRNRMNFASRLGKMRASLRAALGVAFNPPRFEVEFDIDHDGRNDRRLVSAISVSNNPFGQNALLFADDLTTGELGVYFAMPLGSVGVMGLALDILMGRVAESESVTAATAKVLHLRFPKHRRRALCVVDGELDRLPRNVEVRMHPGELKALVPKTA